MENNFNEAKKLLYKYKPKAIFTQATKAGLLYAATHFDNAIMGFSVLFEIPYTDIGDAKFFPEMESHLLNRWITSFAKL